MLLTELSASPHDILKLKLLILKFELFSVSEHKMQMGSRASSVTQRIIPTLEMGEKPNRWSKKKEKHKSAVETWETGEVEFAEASSWSHFGD